MKQQLHLRTFPNAELSGPPHQHSCQFPPLCFAFLLVFLFPLEMEAQRPERRKMEGDSCAAYWPQSGFLSITYTGAELKRRGIFL